MKYTIIATHWIIDASVLILAEECSKYTDRVILLIDKPQDTRWYESYLCKNKWWDFGKFYQRLQENKLSEKDELCITNNTISPLWSFKKLFKHCQNKKYQFTGATSAYTDNELQIVVDWRHIQSFFLYFKWKAVLSLQDYFNRKGMFDWKWDVVEQYELWISTYMKILWYKCKAYIEVEDMLNKYDMRRYDPQVFIRTGQKVIEYKEQWEWNWTFAYPELYIQEWLPFVKNTMLKYGFTCPIIQFLSSKIYNKCGALKKEKKIWM